MMNGPAHGVLTVLATFARLLLMAVDGGEAGLRALIGGAGLSGDVQTLLLIFLLAVFLLGVQRLLKGRLRTGLSLTLILIVAHTLERIAHCPVG